MSQVIRDARGRYVFSAPASAAEILAIATQITEEQLLRSGTLTSPADTKSYLVNRLALRKSECFGVVFLDQRHRVIIFREMFQGTIDGASVHPREVVRAVIEHNAAAVILCHNHPSGIPEPSAADIAITRRLSDALALVDVRVLDHIVVGGTDTVSMAERGLI